MNGERFRELVGGHRRGIVASTLRSLLLLLELPYSGVTSLRNRFYDSGLIKTRQVPFPVVSVGNLTLGGTGKTPMVAWLARFFLEQGFRPGLISRGYGKSTDGVNDEFLELAVRLPTVPHRQNRDRVAAAMEFREHREKEPIDMLILDDAFQHRRIARDLDIVLLDTSEPFGFEHVFPRGTLRETLGGLRRADIVLLSRADGIELAERERIRNRVLSIAPNVIWGEIVHRPQTLVTVSKVEERLESIRGKSVLAFCGIGNPNAFRQMLLRNGTKVVEFVSFPDHHHFTPHDLVHLEEMAKKLKVEDVLCTMKDLVKIERACIADLPIKAVMIDIEFLSGEETVRQRLVKTVDTWKNKKEPR